MNIKDRAVVVAAGAFLLLSGAVSAADLIVEGGQLLGAKNLTVTVGGDEPLEKCYDVTFTATNPDDDTFPDGSCQDVFSGCDDAAQDFAFTESASALSAAQALIDEVFLDTALGNFDSQPALTSGCTSPGACQALIPYAVSPNFDLATVVNNPGATAFTSSVGSLLTTSQFGTNDGITWAIFENCAPQPVPEPNSIIYLLYGLAGLLLVTVLHTRIRRHRH